MKTQNASENAKDIDTQELRDAVYIYFLWQ